VAIVNKRTVTFMPHEIEAWRKSEEAQYRTSRAWRTHFDENESIMSAVRTLAWLRMPNDIAVTFRMFYSGHQRKWYVKQHTLPYGTEGQRNQLYSAAEILIVGHHDLLPDWVDQGWAYRHCRPMQRILASRSSRETSEGGI